MLTYFNETTHYQVHLTSTFSTSQVKGQRSEVKVRQWWPENLVNLIAREQLNGFKVKLTQILNVGGELERFSRSEVNDQDVDQIVNL